MAIKKISLLFLGQGRRGEERKGKGKHLKAMERIRIQFRKSIIPYSALFVTLRNKITHIDAISNMAEKNGPTGKKTLLQAFGKNL
jgi:hypothetical protein